MWGISVCMLKINLYAKNKSGLRKKFYAFGYYNRKQEDTV